MNATTAGISRAKDCRARALPLCLLNMAMALRNIDHEGPCSVRLRGASEAFSDYPRLLLVSIYVLLYPRACSLRCSLAVRTTVENGQPPIPRGI